MDSSVWIDFFRGGDQADLLQTLITLDLVCTNEIILTELVPTLKWQYQNELVESLKALPCSTYTFFWEGVRALQVLNLQKGINKVGIPDLMIVQQCIDHNLELWSLDKHFSLMSKHINLKLFQPPK
ncbi:MAG: PIN domain-containing protein [Spirosomataceae bacterium]